MGNLVFQTALREEMKPYAELSLPAVAKLSRRFESLQQGFGFGIGPALFASLFRLQESDPRTQALWACWDTDRNGVTDVLEILSGLSLISVGAFEAKLGQVFALFDFDGNESLTLEELRICVRTSVAGLCKLMGQEEPAPEEVDRVAARAFGPGAPGHHSASHGDRSKRGVSRQEFLEYVVSVPAVVAAIIRFGTTDAEATRRKYALTSARDRAASKIQTAFRDAKRSQSAASHGSAAASSSPAAAAIARSSPSARPRSGRHGLLMGNPSDFTLPAVRRCKELFDRIDLDGSGSVSVRELVASMSGHGQAEFVGSAVQAFQALDQDGSGSLSFAEMLRAMYPSVKSADFNAMLRELAAATRPPAVADRPTVQRLKAWFDSADNDFNGRVGLAAALRSLAHVPALAHLVPEEGKDPADGIDEARSVTLAELITHLFGDSHSAAKLEQAQRWAQEESLLAAAVSSHDEGRRDLSPTQARELATLFDLFGPNSDGLIRADEVRAHFASLSRGGGSGGGLTAAELDELFAPHDGPDATGTLTRSQFEDLYKRISAMKQKAAAGAEAAAEEAASKPSPQSQAAKSAKDEIDFDADYL